MHPSLEDTLWRGRPLKHLSKEELQDVVLDLIRMLEGDRQRHSEHLDFLKELRGVR